MGKEYNQTCYEQNKDSLETEHISVSKRPIETDYNKKNIKN